MTVGARCALGQLAQAASGVPDLAPWSMVDGVWSAWRCPGAAGGQLQSAGLLPRWSSQCGSGGLVGCGLGCWDRC